MWHFIVGLVYHYVSLWTASLPTLAISAYGNASGIAVGVCILTLDAVMVCWLLLLCPVLSSVTQASEGLSRGLVLSIRELLGLGHVGHLCMLHVLVYGL